jgi:hypothetical protein
MEGLAGPKAYVHPSRGTLDRKRNTEEKKGEMEKTIERRLIKRNKQ